MADRIISLSVPDNDTLEAGEVYPTRWPEIRVRMAPQNTPEWLRVARAMLRKFGNRRPAGNDADALMDPKNLRAADETFVRANFLAVCNGASDTPLEKIKVNGESFAVGTPEGRFELLQMAVFRDELGELLERANARLKSESEDAEVDRGN